MKLVLDTNIVLDLFVFRDEQVRNLRDGLAMRKVQWLATGAMRDELATVLSYGQLAPRMSAAQVSAQQVLDAFDSHVQIMEDAPASGCSCRDRSDQKFIDLAVAHGATLLSKDKQVLALRRKLAAIDVAVAKAL